jgi:hypothetical protein
MVQEVSMLRFQTLACAAVLVIGSPSLVLADEGQDKTSGARRIAMALPKAPAAAKQALVQPALKVQAKAPVALVNPLDEFANRPHISAPASKNALPNNIREVLIDGASKIEQLSRSYNRRVADLIVWIANSMSQPTTITPGSNQNFSGQRVIEPKPLTKNDRSFFQID